MNYITPVGEYGRIVLGTRCGAMKMVARFPNPMLSPYYSGIIVDVHEQTIGICRRRVWPIERAPTNVLVIELQYRYVGVVPFKRQVLMYSNIAI